MIYLATPFSASLDDPAPKITERKRYDQALACAHYFLANREAVFSPIVHCFMLHHIYGLPGTYDFWEPIDKAWIEASKKVYIILLDGYETSTGLAKEWNHAFLCKKPVTFFRPTFCSPIAPYLTSYSVARMERIACHDFAKTGFTPYQSMLKTLNLLGTSGRGLESTS